MRSTIFRGVLAVGLAACFFTPAPAQDEAPRPRLGVTVALEGSHVTIDSVREGSPAEQAGFKAGDIITKVNGKDVKADEDLVAALKELKFGSTVEVTVQRDGKDLKLPVTFPPAPTEPRRMRAIARRGGEEGDAPPPLPGGGPIQDVKANLEKVAKLLDGTPSPEAITQARDLVEKSRAILGSMHPPAGVVAGKPPKPPKEDGDEGAPAGMTDPAKISARVQALLGEGKSMKEIEKAIATEFPGVMIKIGRPGSEGGDGDDDDDDDGPAAKPAKIEKPESRPATESKPSK